MLRAALRNLVAHKLRLLLSGMAIVLAVAFVAGTYVFTDSLRASLDSLIRQNQPDVTIEPAATDFSPEFQGQGKTLTVPTSLVEQAQALPGTQVAVPEILVPNVVILDADGKPLGQDQGGFGAGGAFGRSWVTEPELTASEIAEGSAPTGNQVALDTGSAEQLGVGVGDPVTVLLPDGSRKTFPLSGTTQARSGGGIAVGFVTWDFPRAQRLLVDPGQATSIALLARQGVSQTDLQKQVESLLPAGTRSVTGEEQASQISAQLDSGLGFLNTFLLVFAIVSVFVAAFLIYNTFSMLVAQRTRELALLRAIGASRGQVLHSILAEAVAVAVVASIVGIVVGAGFARGLQFLFQAAGAPFPASALVFAPRTIAVSLIVGLVITVLSAMLPARRAATIPPVAAMRDETPPIRTLRRRTVIGGFLVGTGLGLAIMAPRLAEYGTQRGALMAGFVPLLLPPIVAALMWKTMMQPASGVLNYLLSLVGLGPFPWLTSTQTALLSVVLIDTWVYMPFAALILLAGLQSVPEESVEAALVDGASGWAVFRYIKVPWILPYILLVTLFRAADALKTFDLIYPTTRGGPLDSTRVLHVMAYEEVFRWASLGKAMAIVMVLWLISYAVSFLLMNRWQRQAEAYQDGV